LPALAMTRVKLLAIERDDLLSLVARYPILADRLSPSAPGPLREGDAVGKGPAG